VLTTITPGGVVDFYASVSSGDKSGGVVTWQLVGLVPVRFPNTSKSLLASRIEFWVPFDPSLPRVCLYSLNKVILLQDIHFRYCNI
jgi:hypothetical protein